MPAPGCSALPSAAPSLKAPDSATFSKTAPRQSSATPKRPLRVPKAMSASDPSASSPQRATEYVVLTKN
ncbi:hypothetical protein L596_018118 [Steinernema carpocapsae]|uniref:Uncharacterized protein n=1 Tax=Steinernema carpocapsae TaxID=34508 RepID=A0A4U5N3Q3_STECR|nr:hypothetical protein L596_018118 [Steinernema carpocapsae]